MLTPAMVEDGQDTHIPKDDEEIKTYTPSPTRLLKASCMKCGYIVRVTAKWVKKIGAPICPCSKQKMRVHRGPANKKGKVK